MRNVAKHRGQTSAWGYLFMCSDLKLFVQEEDVAKRLRDPEDGLAKSWKKKEPEGIPNSFDTPPKAYLLSSSEKETLRATLIPGDSCRRCAHSRTAILDKTKTLRSVLKEAFKFRKGSSVGLHFATYYSEFTELFPYRQ